jgi:hypothetical protein
VENLGCAPESNPISCGILSALRQFLPRKQIEVKFTMSHGGQDAAGGHLHKSNFVYRELAGAQSDAPLLTHGSVFLAEREAAI